jgi:type IV pilus assembly protein PilF
MRSLLVFFILLLAGCVNQSSVNKKNVDYEEAAKTRISLGLTYLKNGNYSQAKQNLDQALEFAPRFANAHFSLAYYFQRVGEVERATEYYKNALRLEPQNADIANSYGAFLCQQSQYDDAKQYFLKAVNNKHYANSAETYENMAICAQKEGENDDAIEYLRSALNHQPGRRQSLALLSELYAKKGDFLNAERTLNTLERYGRIDAKFLWLRMDVARQQHKLEQAKDYGTMLLTVYPQSTFAEQYARNPITIPKSKLKTAPDEHIVQKGENLFRISVLYNIAMRKLIEWNELEESGAIQEGMALRLSEPEAR